MARVNDRTRFRQRRLALEVSDQLDALSGVETLRALADLPPSALTCLGQAIARQRGARSAMPEDPYRVASASRWDTFGASA